MEIRGHQTETRSQQLKCGAEELVHCLLSESSSIEEKTIGALKRGKMYGELDTYRLWMAKTHHILSVADKSVNHMDLNSVASMIVSYIDNHTNLLQTYAWALNDPDERERNVSESFEKTIRNINSMSLEHLNRAIAVLGKQGASVTSIKNWYEERKKDQFGFGAVHDPFRAALAAAKYAAEDAASLKEKKLAALNVAMNNILRTNISRYLICIWADANASAGLHTDAADNIGLLMKSYAAEEAKRIMRKAPPEWVKEGFRSESQRATFIERMSDGIWALRAFMSTETKARKDYAYDKMERLGFEKKAIDALKGVVDEISGTNTTEQAIRSSIRTALEKPEDQELLEDVLNEVVKADSMHYISWLISSSSPEQPEFNELVMKGMDKIRAAWLPKTVKNIGTAIELLNGKVEDADHSRIADWFAIRGSEGFEFEQRASLIEGIMSTYPSSTDIMSTEDRINAGLNIEGNLAEEMASYLFDYIHGLEACSNAAAGRYSSALENLSALMAADLENIDFYKAHGSMRNAWLN